MKGLYYSYQPSLVLVAAFVSNAKRESTLFSSHSTAECSVLQAGCSVVDLGQQLIIGALLCSSPSNTIVSLNFPYIKFGEVHFDKQAKHHLSI